MDPQVSQTLAQIIGTALAFALVKVYERRKDKRVQNAAETAATAATEAAKQSTVAAAQTAKQAVDFGGVARQTETLTESTQQVERVVLFMAEELGKNKQVIDWMARRNDDTLAALFSVTAKLQSQAEVEQRVTRLEEFMQEAAELRRGGRHVTGLIDTIDDEAEAY